MSGASSLQYRGGRGLVGAIVVIAAFGILKVLLADVPEAIDQVYWQFAVMAAVVVFLWLLVR